MSCSSFLLLALVSLSLVSACPSGPSGGGGLPAGLVDTAVRERQFWQGDSDEVALAPARTT